MKVFLSRYGFLVALMAILLAGGWSWVGPSGVPALLGKLEMSRDYDRQIEELRRANAETAVDNQRLLGDLARQEEEIKGQLEVLEEDEFKYRYPRKDKSPQTPRPPQ